MANFSGSESGFFIPDHSAAGITSTINVPVNETVTDVTVTLNEFSHTWIGDLTVQLTSPGAGPMDIMWRTGDAEDDCCSDSSDVFGNYTFADGGGDWWAAASAAGSSGVIPNGTYGPTDSMGVATSFVATFAGTNTLGGWTLFINDQVFGDTGSLGSWSINITSAPIPEPSTFGLAAFGFAAYRRRR